MDDKTIIGLIAGATAFATTLLIEIFKNYLSTKTALLNRQQEILKEQKYNYFLPFKNQAEELLSRVIHIERRLEEQQKNMMKHFQVSYAGKSLDWYFTDWEDVEKGISGGYFLTTTIYMNCILYKKISLMQEKFPFIEVTLKKSLAELANESAQDKWKRFLQIRQEDTIQKEGLITHWANMKGDSINLNRIIQAIRTSTIMRHGEGIYYALHYSFGDFVADDKGIVNYEKFCRMLMDDNERIKFQPLIDFWSGLVTPEGAIHERRLEKIRILMLALKLVELSNLK